MSILFVDGISDEGTAKALGINADGRVVYDIGGNSNVRNKIDLAGTVVRSIILLGGRLKQPPVDVPRNVSLIFNQISDADSHVRALERCRVLCDRLPGVPVINHPDAILKNTRDNVYRLLEDVPGVTIPKTVRFSPSSPEEVLRAIESEGIGYPAIFRMAGKHNARTTLRIEGPGDTVKLHAFPLDGRDYYLTSFMDYRDEHGIYYTQRIAMIGGEPYLRHQFYSDHWSVNSSAREFIFAHPELGDPVELADRFEERLLPAAEPALREIARRLELDWFGIDCNISAEGQVLVFEANANMNILLDVPDAIFEGRLAPAKQKLRQYMQLRSRQPS